MDTLKVGDLARYQKGDGLEFQDYPTQAYPDGWCKIEIKNHEFEINFHETGSLYHDDLVLILGTTKNTKKNRGISNRYVVFHRKMMLAVPAVRLKKV